MTTSLPGWAIISCLFSALVWAYCEILGSRQGLKIGVPKNEKVSFKYNNFF